MRRILRFALAAAALGALVFALGPTLRVDLDADFAPPRPLPPSLEDLDATLVAHETGPIVPGTEKRILWANGIAPTPLALVYLHGFSASRQEIAPFVERLSESLGANAFQVRLTGHGREDDALGDARANDWLRDVAEAMEIARRIGGKTVLIGTSTGATLAALATQLWPDEIDALVLISPNFGVADPLAAVLEWPWSHVVLPRFIPTRSWQPTNALQAKYWTHEYRTPVLFQMQSLVRAARALPFERMTVPALFLASPEDDVVSYEKTREVIARWPAALREVHEVRVARGRPTHVIVGDILNPEQTEPLQEKTTYFLRNRLHDSP